jgi:hypothetical protein
MTTVERSSQGRTGGRLIVALTVLTLTVGTSSMARAQDERPGPSAGTDGAGLDGSQYRLVSPIEGTWLFNIDVVGQGITFNSLISFAAGGVLVTNGSLPAPAPFYGSWRPAGPNSFHAAFYTFIPDTTGTGVATSKVRIRLQLTSRNELTGTGMGYTCDAQGENCTQIESHQFKGKRILPE